MRESFGDTLKIIEKPQPIDKRGVVENTLQNLKREKISFTLKDLEEVLKKGNINLGMFKNTTEDNIDPISLPIAIASVNLLHQERQKRILQVQPQYPGIPKYL